jgi:hypothetical protein
MTEIFKAAPTIKWRIARHAARNPPRPSQLKAPVKRIDPATGEALSVITNAPKPKASTKPFLRRAKGYIWGNADMGEATRRREAAQAATEAWGRALEISPEGFDAWRDQFIEAVDITRGVLAAACGNASIIWTLAHIYNRRTDAIDDISASVVEFANASAEF